MQLHISPSLRHVTVVTGKGLREFIKVKVGSRKFSYQMMFYSLLFFTFLLRFVFVLSTVDSIDGEPSPCSSLGTFLLLPSFLFLVKRHFRQKNIYICKLTACLGKRLKPKLLGRRVDSGVSPLTSVSDCRAHFIFTVVNK